jgi:enamine deaminase RidA (YjgF/YER057c/UK114 family)
MGREVLRTDAAPGSALYAQGTKNGSIVCVSGMVGIDPGTGQLAGPTIQEQTRQLWRTARRCSRPEMRRSTTCWKWVFCSHTLMTSQV